MGKRVAVIIREKERQYEGFRCSLGLLLERHIVSMFVLNHEIALTEEYRHNMEFIDEMGGVRYSNVTVNVDEYGFKATTLEQVARKIGQNEVVIPF